MYQFSFLQLHNCGHAAATAYIVHFIAAFYSVMKFR